MEFPDLQTHLNTVSSDMDYKIWLENPLDFEY